MRRYVGFILILLCARAAYSADGGTTPSFKLSGDVTLLSHYVENGLSQSDKSPALQGSFWFNLGSQFRLGLWGSNTNFLGDDDHFNLRATGDIKVDFSSTSNLRIAYSHSQYYNGGKHNGNILSAHLTFFSLYRILFDNHSNWEASEKKSSRYGFGHLMNVLGSWKWDNEIAYNTPNSVSHQSYFDARTGLGTTWGVIFFEGAVTGTNDNSQFNGAGDFFFILSASTEL